MTRGRACQRTLNGFVTNSAPGRLARIPHKAVEAINLNKTRHIFGKQDLHNTISIFARKEKHRYNRTQLISNTDLDWEVMQENGTQATIGRQQERRVPSKSRPFSRTSSHVPESLKVKRSTLHKMHGEDFNLSASRRSNNKISCKIRMVRVDLNLLEKKALVISSEKRQIGLVEF